MTPVIEPVLSCRLVHPSSIPVHSSPSTSAHRLYSQRGISTGDVRGDMVHLPASPFPSAIWTIYIVCSIVHAFECESGRHPYLTLVCGRPGRTRLRSPDQDSRIIDRVLE